MADDFRHDRIRPAVKTVVFALYDKVSLQDVAAPLEVFARANDVGACYEVLLVSLDGKPVKTTAFTSLNVDIPAAKAPAAFDTLMVPGGVPADFAFTPGEHAIPEEPTPDAVTGAVELVGLLAPRVGRVASVCTGAFVLASLGAPRRSARNDALGALRSPRAHLP